VHRIQSVGVVRLVLRGRLMLRLGEEHHSPHRARGWRSLLREAEESNWEGLREIGDGPRHHLSPSATYILNDALEFLTLLPPATLSAIVTDPPYGLEYEDKDHRKLKMGRGGVWRIPPTFDGANRKPLPRFTVLSDKDLQKLHCFFTDFGVKALRALAPGGHLFIASNPLLSSMTFYSLQEAGFEKRGEIIRLVQTLRGGYKPKGAEFDFPEVSVMPRACWEPWGIFRKPFEGTVAENLRRWGTGGLRRIGDNEPLKDVIACSPTRGREKEQAPHPSLKPQRFLRQLVRASLPLGVGIVYDPFAGSGSTLAAAEAVGYKALGTDRDHEYLDLGRRAFAGLAALSV
jgi:DNA modification methylase